LIVTRVLRNIPPGAAALFGSKEVITFKLDLGPRVLIETSRVTTMW
jgi:hypothetical protein